MTGYAHIAGRLFNQPIMLRTEKAEMLIAVLAEKLGVARLDRMDGSAMTLCEMNAKADEGRMGRGASHRLYEIADGIAFIPVEGTLVHKSGWIGTYSGMMGYDGIAAMLRQARMDDEVRGIWLDIHSPGGEVSGCFDLAEEIAAGSKRNGGKPVWAMVNEEACSAAYAIACAADKVYGTRTSVAGSIGAYILYVDWTDALSEDGIKVKFYREYDLKARGSGLEEMDPETDKHLQSSVAQTVDLFTRHVARHRRGMTVAGIKAMRSQWYDAPQALQLGLIDGIMSEIEAVAKFQRHLARNS